MHTQKKLYDLHLQTFGNINDISKQLQYELKRISKLWDKTDEMHYTLFSKKEIMKLIDDEIKNILWIQLVAICGLPFVHNVIYHYSAVFLATYIRQPVLYAHYKALKAINDRLEYRFLSAAEPKMPLAEPPSSS